MKCVGAEQGPPCKRCIAGNHECIFEESNRGKRTSKYVPISLFVQPYERLASVLESTSSSRDLSRKWSVPWIPCSNPSGTPALHRAWFRGHLHHCLPVMPRRPFSLRPINLHRLPQPLLTHPPRDLKDSSLQVHQSFILYQTTASTRLVCSQRQALPTVVPTSQAPAEKPLEWLGLLRQWVSPAMHISSLVRRPSICLIRFLNK